MRFDLDTSSVWKRHLKFGVAIFFVLFVFIDIATPDLCGEAADLLSARSYLSALTPKHGDDSTQLAVNITGSEDSRQNQPSDQAPHDADCLGCCAHVLPGTGFVNVIDSDLRPAQHPSANSSISSPPLRGPDRPPRLS